MARVTLYSFLVYGFIIVCLQACSESKIDPKISLYAESVQSGSMVAVGDTLLLSWKIEAGSSSISHFEIKENNNVLQSNDNINQNPYIASWSYVVKVAGNYRLVLWAKNKQNLQDSLSIVLLASKK